MADKAPTLDQLRVFLAVVERESFSGAANALHRAQSVVSYTIANLEAQLGLALFERARRRPVLTEAGRAVLMDARRVDLLMRELTARAEGLTRGLEGEVSLAVDVMYPPGSQTVVHVGGVAKPLEGERRPGHFDGVATVVLKLFDIVQPDLAVFGRKDAQQCAVIERLVRDLDVPVRLVVAETMRESDGLAMSSRNSYLSPDQRAVAPVLQRALRAGEHELASRNVAWIESAMRDVAKGIDVDYLVLVDPETFEAPSDFDRDLLLAGAIRIGNTRLIDNIRVPRRR